MPDSDQGTAGATGFVLVASALAVATSVIASTIGMVVVLGIGNEVARALRVALGV